MAIAYVKKEDIALSFENGFAQTELLPGTYQGGVRAYRARASGRIRHSADDSRQHPGALPDGWQRRRLCAAGLRR